MDPRLIEELNEFRGRRNRLMGKLLRKSYRFLESLAGEKLHEEGYDNFRIAHLIILMNIDAAQGTIINSLSQRCGITKQAISKIIKELQEQDYVSTEKHPADARATLVRVTENGVHFMLAWQRVTQHIDTQFRDIIGTKRLEQLKDILEEIVEHYETNVAKTDIDLGMLKN